MKNQKVQPKTNLKKENYEKVNSEITRDWPKWKQEAYNITFATSTHAKKITIS